MSYSAKELNDKLTYCTSSSAEDRYAAELSSIYEDKLFPPGRERTPEELMTDLLKSKPILLRSDELDGTYRGRNEMYRYRFQQLRMELGDEKFQELFDKLGGSLCLT